MHLGVLLSRTASRHPQHLRYCNTNRVCVCVRLCMFTPDMVSVSALRTRTVAAKKTDRQALYLIYTTLKSGMVMFSIHWRRQRKLHALYGLYEQRVPMIC